MAKIKYRGPADVRVLEAKDMKQFKLEGFTKTEFRRHEPTEISDEAAELILGKPGTFGQFDTVDETEAEGQTLEDAADSGEADSTSQLGVDSTAGTTAAGTATTGGSSTGGSTRKRST